MDENPSAKKRRDSNAAGSFLGYSLQCTRLTALLFDDMNKGGHVSLELIDDVAKHASDRTNSEVHQLKIYGKNNPIGDNSEELWKTLRIWLGLVQEKKVDAAKTKFVLYVRKKRKGPIAESFSKASNIEEADEAIIKAEKDTSDAAFKINATAKQDKDEVFKADRKLLCAIVSNFKLEFAENSVTADLVERAKAAFRFDDESIQMLCIDYALGWVKRRCDVLLEAKQAAVISCDEFQAEMESFLKKLRDEGPLFFLPSKVDALEAKQHSSKMFVRQLEVLNYEDFEVRMISAVNDFLSAKVARANWSDGTIHSSSFEVFQTDLLECFRNNKTKSDILHKAQSEAERGQLLFSTCVEYRAVLQGMAAPDSFTRGSFHELANSLFIGWHPNWERLLK